MRYTILIFVLAGSAGCCRDAVEAATETFLLQNTLLQDQNDRLQIRVNQQDGLLAEKDAQIRELQQALEP